MENLIKNQIICGDCVEVLWTFPTSSVDLVVTSPPYGSMRGYQSGSNYNFYALADRLYSILAPGGIVCWIIGDQIKDGTHTLESFEQVLWFKQIGFNVHNIIHYAKINFVPKNHRRFEERTEFVFILTKGRPKTFNPIRVPCKTAGMVYNAKRNSQVYDGHAMRRYRDEVLVTKVDKIKDNIWEYSCGMGQTTKYKKAFAHPAVMHEGLARDLILSWSNEGDWVVDPFSGSGSSAVMAAKLNRQYIGIDISQEYCYLAEERIKHELA